MPHIRLNPRAQKDALIRSQRRLEAEAKQERSRVNESQAPAECLPLADKEAEQMSAMADTEWTED